MFEASIYVNRRKQLKENVKSGILFFPGHEESPMNSSGNLYAFRQESSFLYYFGLDAPGLYAVIDVDNGEEIIFGNDFSLDDMVWMGPQESLSDRAKLVGVSKTAPERDLYAYIEKTVKQGRQVHYLPQYRVESKLKLEKLFGIKPDFTNHYVSLEFAQAVVDQRSIKSPEEIEEIEKALDISYEMNTLAMRLISPGKYEREISGAVEGISLAMGSGISFPVIFSVHGETLHNHYHGNLMKEGDIAVLDSGAESLLHYASDITRTIPVSGRFTDKQKDVYNIVLDSHLKSIELIKPGITYKEVHLKSAEVIAAGLTELGIMKGDPAEAVRSGAHALFYPHGLGHMLGLDVHDMEGIDENLVGYDNNVKRSGQFGLSALRLGRELLEGFCLTVEPGCYFIPQLIDNWKSENKHSDYLNYDKIEEYRDFGGIRIEDDILVTSSGAKVLGKKKIPKTVKEVEEFCNE